MFLVPQRLERTHGGMQSKETVQVNNVLAGNGDRWPAAVVRLLGVWHHDVQAVSRAALEQHHKALARGAPGGGLRGINRARKKTGNHAGAYDRQRAMLQENSASDCHGACSLLLRLQDRSRPRLRLSCMSFVPAGEGACAPARLCHLL